MTISHEAGAPGPIKQDPRIESSFVLVQLNPFAVFDYSQPDVEQTEPVLSPGTTGAATHLMRPASREVEVFNARHRAVMEIVYQHLPADVHHDALVAIDHWFTSQYDPHIQGTPRIWQGDSGYSINLEPNSHDDPPAHFQFLAAGFLVGLNALAAKAGGRKALEAFLALEIAITACVPRSAPIPFPESPAGREAPTPRAEIESALLASLKSEGAAFDEKSWIKKIFPAQYRAIIAQFPRTTVEEMRLGIFGVEDPTTKARLGYAFELRHGNGSYLFVGGDERGNGGFWVRVPEGAVVDQKGNLTTTFKTRDGHYQPLYKNPELKAFVDPDTGMMTVANVAPDKLNAVGQFITDHLRVLQDFTRTKVAKEGDTQFQLRGRYDDETGEFYTIIQVVTGKGETQFYVLGPDGKIRERIPQEGQVYRLNLKTGEIEVFTKDDKFVGWLVDKDQILALQVLPATPTPPPTEKLKPTAPATREATATPDNRVITQPLPQGADPNRYIWNEPTVIQDGGITRILAGPPSRIAESAEFGNVNLYWAQRGPLTTQIIDGRIQTVIALKFINAGIHIVGGRFWVGDWQPRQVFVAVDGPPEKIIGRVDIDVNNSPFIASNQIPDGATLNVTIQKPKSIDEFLRGEEIGIVEFLSVSRRETARGVINALNKSLSFPNMRNLSVLAP